MYNLEGFFVQSQSQRRADVLMDNLRERKVQTVGNYAKVLGSGRVRNFPTANFGFHSCQSFRAQGAIVFLGPPSVSISLVLVRHVSSWIHGHVDAPRTCCITVLPHGRDWQVHEKGAPLRFRHEKRTRRYALSFSSVEGASVLITKG